MNRHNLQASGKELWVRDLDEFAAMPAEQAKEARELRRAYHERIRQGNELRYEWKTTTDAARKEELFKSLAALGVAESKITSNDSQWGAGTVETALFATGSLAPS